MVIAPSNPAFNMLDHIADATNPLLGLALLAGLILLYPHDKRRFWSIFIATIVSVVLIQAIRQMTEVQVNLWKPWGLDFSTHAAMTIAFCLPLAILWKRVWWLFLAIFIAYDSLMMAMAYHSLADIVSTTLLILPICGLCHFVAQRRIKSSTPVTS